MARVFPEDSPVLDPNNIEESFNKVERYLRYMQERIEHMNFAQAKIDERQQEELDLVVERQGSVVRIGSNIVTQVSLEGIQSQITQNASSISSIVQSVGSNGTVTAASIVQAVNNAGSSVKISADHITLSGDVVLRSMLTDGSTQISGSNITTGTINAQNVNVTNINGQNVVSAVANATNATNAAVANALNTALSGFASTMLGYVNQAMALASTQANAVTIADLKMYKTTVGNAAALQIDFGTFSGHNLYVRFFPAGISDGSYWYYLLVNTPYGEFGLRSTLDGSVASVGKYTP